MLIYYLACSLNELILNSYVFDTTPYPTKLKTVKLQWVAVCFESSLCRELALVYLVKFFFVIFDYYMVGSIVRSFTSNFRQQTQ
jgi:hypothetical protein